MHWSYLDDFAVFLRLQNAVTSTASHSRDIQKLCAIDHVVVYIESDTIFKKRDSDHLTMTASDTDTIRLHLKAQCALVFPDSRGHFWFHAWRQQLASLIRRPVGEVSCS